MDSAQLQPPILLVVYLLGIQVQPGVLAHAGEPLIGGHFGEGLGYELLFFDHLRRVRVLSGRLDMGCGRVFDVVG